MSLELELRNGKNFFYQEENPKKPGSKSYDRYEAYKYTICFQEFLEEGGSLGDFKNDLKKGYITPMDDEEEPEEVIATPVEPAEPVEELVVVASQIPSPTTMENIVAQTKKNIAKKKKKVVASPEESKCYARVWCEVVGLDKSEVPNGTQVRYVSMPYCRCKNKAMKNGEYCKTHQKRYDEKTLTMGDCRDEPHDFIGFASRSKKHSFLGYGLLSEYDPDDDTQYKRDELEGKWCWRPEEWREDPLKWHTEEWHDEQ